MVTLAGAAITGRPLTVTATVLAAAALPKLSVAGTVMVSDPAVPLVSVRLARSVLRVFSETPLTVMLVPAALKPVADKTPWVSLTVAEKVSGAAVLPVSETLTPPIAVALPTPMILAPGTAINGRPLTVTATVLAAAALPKLSVAWTVMVSLPAVPSVSERLARSVLRVLRETPLTVMLVPAALKPVADRTPWVSLTVAEKVSGAPVLPVSETLTPPIAAALPSGMVTLAGAAITGRPLTVTATVLAAAALPKLSVAWTVMVSLPAVPSVSERLARSVLRVLRETPLTVMLVPAALKPVADKTPWVSLTVAEKVSGAAVLPVSETLTPVIPAALPTPMTLAPGTATTGSPLTVTAIELVPDPPLPSVALRVMVSVPADGPLSVRVPRSVLTWLRVPLIVRSVVPEPVIEPAPVAESRPVASVSVAEKVSPAVASASVRLTPVMAMVWPTAMVAVVGAPMTGGALTLMAMVLATALPPRPSLAFTVMVSAPSVPLVSLRSVRSVFTWASVPARVRLVVPEPVIVPWPPVVEKSPLVSETVTVKVSAAPGSSGSAMLIPGMAWAWPCEMLS